MQFQKFNESILSSIATGVLTLNSFGEIDSVNEAASKIIKIPINELIGNHYMYTFEKDESNSSPSNGLENFDFDEETPELFNSDESIISASITS